MENYRNTSEEALAKEGISRAFLTRLLMPENKKYFELIAANYLYI